MIEAACRWARTRAADAPEASDGEVDAELIKERAREIAEHIKEANSVKRKCANIDNSSKGMREWAESAESGPKAKIDAVVESLRTGGQGSGKANRPGYGGSPMLGLPGDPSISRQCGLAACQSHGPVRGYGSAAGRC